MSLMYLNQFYTMFILYTKTYNDSQTQKIETLNEIIILLTIYHFFCFTDFVTDVETRSTFVSYSMLGMTGLNMIVNLAPVVVDLMFNYKQKARKLWQKLCRFYRIKQNENRRVKRAQTKEQ